MNALAATPDRKPAREWLGYAALLCVGALLYVLTSQYPADMPVWMPWEFSWPEFLATALTLAWFFRGLRVLPKSEHPPLWRSISFVLGVASLYIVLQTHIDYYAQHMFFVHRWAHFVLHHAGPFFIAMGVSGPVLYAGMPDFLKPVVDARPVRALMNFLQHPAIAPVLFVGLLYFWLISSIHTIVMLDRTLYDIMNWTMALNGIMFWSLVLDPRPKPPARLSPLIRGLMILLIELPQMVLGAILSLSMTDYYPVYTICGRALDFSALSDMHYGGLIIWLPGTLTSFAAMIVVLVNMRLNEEKKNMRKVEIVIAALLIAMPASAATVTVKSAWFRSLPAKLPAGGYFTLHNNGAQTITLTGAEFSACGMLMLHKTENKSGTGMMMDMPTIPVPAGSDLKFAPGGYHLMCMDPTPAMKPGRTVSVTLEFSDGTKTHVPFAVKNAKGQ